MLGDSGNAPDNLDPVAPPSWGEAVAATLPASLHVVFPPFAHGGSHPCLDRLVNDFIDRGPVRSLDTSCVEQIPPPAFPLP